jgi:hypothetical protein
MELIRNEMVGQESSWGLPEIGSRLLCCWLSGGVYKPAARNVRKKSWMNIYVGQLPDSVTEDELKAMFTHRCPRTI